MIVDSNNDAMRFCASYSEKIDNLLMPLRNTFEIDNLFYVTLFPDENKAFFLSNNFSVAEKVMRLGKFSKANNNVLQDIRNDNKIHKFLWPQDPLPTNQVGKLMKESNIKIGMSLISQRCDGSIINIGFASSKNNKEFINNLINYEEVLIHFIQYFESESESILRKRRQNLIKFDSQFHPQRGLVEEGAIVQNLKEIITKKIFFNNKQLKNYLTRREYECLLELCKGKSFKQIANSLGISTRTVEAHINTCKLKFEVSNKFDLIHKANINFCS